MYSFGFWYNINKLLSYLREGQRGGTSMGGGVTDEKERGRKKRGKREER